MRRRPPTLDIAGATDAGPRPENQDRWAVGPGWAVVCDGVGGHAGGSVAARTALDVVVAHLAEGAPAAGSPGSVGAAEDRLAAAAHAANEAVVAGRAGGPGVAEMATTLTAAVAVGRRRGLRWVVLQVGDSPAWLVGPDAARAITWDHNLVGELVRAGALTPEQAIGHRGRHVVTRALGTAATVEPELHTVDPAGAALVLASDGLSDVALPEAAVAPLAAAPDAAAAARSLVALALGRGTMDNVTVVVAR